MKEKLHIQFSPTRLKQMKKIALSGSRAKLKILNGKTKEGFQILKTTAQKFKSFATDLADRIPKALAARISLDLFSHFEQQSSKRLGIPKGIVLGGVLALMASLPAAGQIINVANTNDSGVGSLRQAIIDANANGAAGIIRLANGTTYTISSNLPIVTGTDIGGTLQIISTGTTNAIIDGARVPNTSGFRPITMDPNSNLTLTNITLQNGFAGNDKGGAIYNNRGDLTITNSIITTSEATGAAPNGKGGGIYSKGAGGSASVLIQNSTISLNSASTYGGGILNYYNSSLIISSSSISGNTSNGRGGGIMNYYHSPLTISSSSISGNTSNNNGGGIANYYYSPLTISSSSISGNTSTDKGGGIMNYNGDINIQASSLTSNQSATQGGAMMIYGSGVGPQNILIQNTTISGNTSTGSAGGGVYHDNFGVGPNTITLQHVTMSDNTGVGTAGLANTGASNITLQNTIIANNTGNDFDINGATINAASAGNLIRTGTGAADGSVVSTADPLLNALSGGVQTLQAGSPAIDAASAGVATANDQLGVLRAAPHDIGAVAFAVPPCIFDVTINADAGAGSLRQAITDANANIDDCIIYVDGGETYTISSNLPSIVDQATGGTLQIICTGTSNAIIDGQRVPNTSGFRPITMDPNSDLTLTNITLQNGFAATNGGAIYNNRGDLRISNSIITNSQANTGRGGGIFSSGSGGAASVLIQNSTISMNTASTQGGGIYNRFNSSLTISSSSISGNTSNNRGSGIFNRDNSPLTISSSSISGNTSNSYGGGIYNRDNSPLTISSSSISGNTSNSRGGGIWHYNANLTIQASSFTTNQSATQGGGMMIYGAPAGGQNVLIQNTTISGNTATGSAGGGIYHFNLGGVNNITLQHVTMSDNTGNAAATGDGFHNNGASNITFQNTIIANSIGAGDDFGLSGSAPTSHISTGTIVADGSLVDAGNVFAIDPLLGALTLNSGFLIHPLQTGSPALGAGANIGIATDQVGNARVLASPSIGAVEVTEVSGACMVVAAPSGVTNTWIGCTNSDWATATNWSTGVVPTASDVVYVPIVAANQLIIDEVATCAKMVVQIGAKCLVDYNAGGKLLIKF